MSQSFERYYDHACEFTISLKLNIPIFLEPEVLVKDAPCVRQTLPVHLEPEIVVASDVSAKPPVCIPQTPCYRNELPAYTAE